MSDEVKRIEVKKTHHHVLSYSSSLSVFLFLLVFTVITVAIAQLHFGAANFTIAMLIATAKAMAVMLYFMGLRHESTENRVIFFSGYAFLGILLFFVMTDYFARNSDMRTEGGPVLVSAATGALQFDKPWESSPEILAHGKDLFQKQACYTCHGEKGLGDGAAGIALGARNFVAVEGWKNGRKTSEIYTTLTNGLGAMPAYPVLPVEDRLALAHYVRNFMEEPPEVSAEDFASIGIDVTKEDGGLGGEQSRSIPIDFALERYLAN